MRRIVTTVNRLDDVLEQLCNEFYTEHVKIMARRTVDRVPVDSGRAKGSITASVGSPHIVDNRIDPTGSAAKGDIGNLNVMIGQTAYVTAGVEYAGELELGSSTQAPSGFMRVTVSEAQQHADDAARNI